MEKKKTFFENFLFLFFFKFSMPYQKLLCSMKQILVQATWVIPRRDVFYTNYNANQPTVKSVKKNSLLYHTFNLSSVLDWCTHFGVFRHTVSHIYMLLHRTICLLWMTILSSWRVWPGTTRNFGGKHVSTGEGGLQ